MTIVDKCKFWHLLWSDHDHPLEPVKVRYKARRQIGQQHGDGQRWPEQFWEAPHEGQQQQAQDEQLEVGGQVPTLLEALFRDVHEIFRIFSKLNDKNKPVHRR